MSEAKQLIRRVHLSTLGCPKNQVDTEVMAHQLRRAGLELTADPAQADCIVVNTCAFLKASQEESVEKILAMANFRKEGTCQKLVVTGCLASRFPTEIEPALPEVDHFLGTADLHRITEVMGPTPKPVNLISDQERSSPPQEYLLERYLDTGTFSRYLKIAEGCDRTCSFCIIPKIRGPQRSRSLESLRAEARHLVELGAREINLIAQDLTAFGHDLEPAKRLEDLLEVLLDELQDACWLRLHYVYPQRISDHLLSLFQHPSLLPYLDMPLQHISDAVLKRMNRGTTGAFQRKMIEKLRTRIPGITLRTTFIVGFPGEEDGDFRELLGFLREVRFDHAAAFSYSQEEGTAAALLPDQISAGEKKARYEELMALQQTISREKNQERIGQTMEALVLGPSEESDLLLTARCRHQAPEIDGLTYLTDDETNGEHGSLTPGDRVRLRIVDAHDYDLAGVVVARAPTFSRAKA